MPRSRDPNDKLAPAGQGAPAFIQADGALAYTIRFENQSDATAPAREIFITDMLDPDLDLDTFELTEIAFADQRISVPPGLSHYATTVPITANGTDILVEVQAALDRDTRQFKSTLRAVDPNTGWFPENPLVGPLYPNDASHRGEGSVSYVVRPRAGLPTGTVIENRARIVFDYNDPIDTPLVRNTLDAAAPVSQVAPLPPETLVTTFTVSWSGADEPSGSGLAGFHAYASMDGGDYIPWLLNTPTTNADFTGAFGHTYGFYSIARDNVGHIEAAPATPDTVIFVRSPNDPPVLDPIGDKAVDEGSLLTFTATATDPNPGDVLTFSLDSGAPTGASINPVTGAFTWTPDDGPGTYSITIRVRDNATPALEDFETITITVNNVAPTATIIGPSNGVRFQPRLFILGASDPSPVDQASLFVYEIDWNGDDVFDESVTGTAGTRLEHVYTATGAYTVKVRATDKDGGIGATTTLIIAIQVAEMQGDTLAVGGSFGNDTILFTPRGEDILVTVTGEFQADFTGVGRIVAFGGPGNDILVARAITVPSELHGGAGNDQLIGGNGLNVLLGGDGADYLLGGANRDLLIGGFGSDWLFGGGRDDLLLAGDFLRGALHGEQSDALNHVMTQWQATDSYANRTNALRDFIRARAADDDQEDMLTGGDGLDWFFANLTGTGMFDRIADPLALELIEEL